VKKAKVIKLADPTVFTISSPSAWQKPKLSSPDIVSAVRLAALLSPPSSTMELGREGGAQAV